MSPTVINYATGPRRREMPFTVIHMTIWLSLVSVAAIFVGCFAIPKFDIIFRDFHSELPGITRLTLAASHVCRDDFGWIALLLLSVAPSFFDRMNGRRWAMEGVPRRTRILFGLFMFMAVAAFVLVVLSLFAPMVYIGGGVSSPTPSAVTVAH